jgi:predicted nucleic acid-binding protein
MRAYFDSDIVIGHLRDDKKASDLLRRVSNDPDFELWIGAMQRAEIVFNMKSGEEKLVFQTLSRFKTQPVTQAIVDKGSQLYRQWNPSHGIDINDAILAATVEITGGKIYTLNTKHFPMPHVVSVKGW